MENGTRLGPYEIVSQLGAGGMGEVWLANDTRLGRQVAIKVLPAAFAEDKERLARFEQEARASASLNHPHIAVVHDIGSEAAPDGTTTHFMVQEFLDGETLRDVLGRDRMPLEQALRLATEISEALDAAHKAGIVHRDLKPENVFVTPDGHAKVLDFGLAKLTEAAASDQQASMSPTMLGTAAGVVMGTAGYMAPEQIRGEPDIDGRADVFAAGCVLYEMITGQRAFAGENVHDTLNQLLSTSAPDARSVVAEVPERVEWILEKAMAKPTRDRYQSAADMSVDLRAAAARGPAPARATAQSAGDVSEVADSRPGGRPLLAAALMGGGLIIGVAAGWQFAPGEAATDEDSLRLEASIPDRVSSAYNRVISIAPDGNAFAASLLSRLWIRPLRDRDGHAIEGAEEFREPTFSPDGTRVAFWSGGHLNQVAVDGASPVAVGPEVGRPVGTSWAEDGSIYIGQGTDGIWRIPPGGDDPEQVATVDPGQLAHGPEPLPGGEWLVFAISDGMSKWDASAIVAQSLITGERHLLVDGGRAPRYAASGHLLFVRRGVLYAAAIDLGTTPTVGAEVAVESEIRTSAFDMTGAAYYDISDNGTLAYLPTETVIGQHLVWHAQDQSEEKLPIAPQSFGELRLSGDQRRLVADVLDPVSGSQVYLFDVDRPSGTQLSDGGNASRPVWSHDEKYVYYASDRGGDYDIWRRPVDMSAASELVYAAPGDQVPSDVFRDGSGLVFVEMTPRNNDIWRLDFDEDSEPEPLVATPDDEIQGSLSPDGSLLVYQAFVTGRWGIYVHAIETGQRFHVGAGYAPAWAPDGSRILFNAQGGLMENTIAYVNITSLDPFEWGNQQDLEVLPGEGIVFQTNRAGTRVLVARAIAAAEGRQRVAVTLNWFDELRERVPPVR